MNKGLFDAREISNHILAYCISIGKPITNLRLQKMLYFIWIDFYKESKGKWLFENAFCAWPLGPVITEVYYKYKHNAGLPIKYTDDIDLGKYNKIINRLTDKYMEVPVCELLGN